MKLINIIKRLTVRLVRKKLGPVAITLHHVPDTDFGWIEEFIDGLLEKYEFLSPNEILSGKTLVDNKLLLSFDDGFLSQKRLTNKILDPRNIKAVFFVPTSFISLRGEEAFEFAKTRFFPNSYPQDLSFGAYDAMSWSDLSSLLDNDHVIGGHTGTHPQLSMLTNDQQRQEIVDSADILGEKLGISIKQFAYPFGSIQAVNRASVDIAQERFEISYSNIRGMLDEQASSHFLFRQNIVPGMPMWMAMAAVEGRLDWWYANIRRSAY